MAILNRTSDGTHSVLVVIYKLLLQEGAMERERIIQLCAPQGIADPKHVRQTLSTWIELGLLEEAQNDRIKLHSNIKKSETLEERLPHLARRIVMLPENNANFWAREKSRSADFSRGITWLLAQDVYTTELIGWSDAEKLLLNQVPHDLMELEGTVVKDFGLIQNDTRWPGLKAYAPWLGFAWTARPPRGQYGVLMIDPTEAIREVLHDVFGRHKNLTATEFVALLAQRLPVLDGGEYRLQVEEKLRGRTGPDAWKAPPHGQLSTSLSRALLRLRTDGTLKAELRADARDRKLLTGRNGGVIEQISHVSLNTIIL